MTDGQLSKGHIQIVQDEWKKIHPNWLDIGAEYFIRLFVKFPSVKAAFHMFDDTNDMAEIKKSKKLRAHLINFGGGLGAMFDNLDDLELLEIVIQKLVANHWRRENTVEQFQAAFKEFLVMLAEDEANDKTIMEAWEAAFGVIGRIFNESYEVMDMGNPK